MQKGGEFMNKIGQWGEELPKRLHLEKLLYREKNSCEMVELLYPRMKKDEALRKLWGERLALILLLLAAAALAWLYCFTSEPEESILSDGRYLSRQEEDLPVEVQVKGSAESGEWEKTMELNLKQRKFTEAEKEELGRQLQEYVDQQLPGENPSLEAVAKPLHFVTELPGTEAELDWSWDEDYIKENGRLVEAKIPKDGVDTDIMLKASWLNWKKTLYYKVHLVPAEFSLQEQQIREVKDALKNTMKESAAEAVVELPSSVGDTRLSYHMEQEKKSYMLFYIVLALIILLPVLWREKYKKESARREEQMYLDYPGIVNKVMLLLGAGLTFRRAVERLVTEYERSCQEGGAMHYAYEELCIMLQEMKDGVSETKAIENYGKKCRLMPYLRFSSVISQNLKKGAEGILEILEKEALEAMEQRRERVLQLGETAGTKLLFPMMVMLGLVMGIIMVPAFMTL